MKIAFKSPDGTTIRRGWGIFQANTPPTDEPKHLFRLPPPRNPLFPALRSVPKPGSGASRTKQILAAHNPVAPGEEHR